MRASTSASEACGLMSLSLPVAIGCSWRPPVRHRGRSGEQPDSASQGNAAQGAFGGVVTEADTAVVEKAREGGPASQSNIGATGHRAVTWPMPRS